jgi:xanthine/uracil permease
VGYYIAAILTFVGLFPLIGGVLLAIPTSVFGGAVMLMFGTVAVAGFNILREVEMDNRSFVILAVSLAAGLGVTFLPESLEHFPSGVRACGVGNRHRFHLCLSVEYCDAEAARRTRVCTCDGKSRDCCG